MKFKDFRELILCFENGGNDFNKRVKIKYEIAQKKIENIEFFSVSDDFEYCILDCIVSFNIITNSEVDTYFTSIFKIHLADLKKEHFKTISTVNEILNKKIDLLNHVCDELYHLEFMKQLNNVEIHNDIVYQFIEYIFLKGRKNESSC